MAFDNKKFLEKQRAQNEDLMMKLGFTEKSTTPQGQTMYSKPTAPTAPTAPIGGQVGQSFGKMMGGGAGGFGGGMPSMGELEAASKRLANDAATRERKTEEERFKRERSSQMRDQKRLEIKQEIARLERQIELERANPSFGTGEKIGQLESGIQGLRSQLSNLDRSEPSY